MAVADHERRLDQRGALRREIPAIGQRALRTTQRRRGDGRTIGGVKVVHPVHGTGNQTVSTVDDRLHATWLKLFPHAIAGARQQSTSKRVATKRTTNTVD